MKIETYTDTAGEKRWSLVADNGKTVAQGEGFAGHIHRAIDDSIVAAASQLLEPEGLLVVNEDGKERRVRVIPILNDDGDGHVDAGGVRVEWTDVP